MSAGDHTLKMSVGDDWQLVHVFTAHQLKRLDRRRLRVDGAQLTDRAHHAFHAGLRPPVATDAPDFLGRYQTRYPVIFDHDEAPASSSQHKLIDKIFQADVPLYSRAVAFHDVGDTPVAESRHYFCLSVARARRVEEEPPDEGQPQSAEIRAHEEPEQT